MTDSAYNPRSGLSPSYRQRVMKWLKRALRSLCVGYAVLIALLMLMETSMIYPAPKFPAGNWQPGFSFEDMEFASADGVKIHGWLLRNRDQLESPRYFLYCHGNGENVSHAGSWAGLEIVTKLGGHVLVFDYRGYGKSEGSPHEAGIKLDAERALAVLCDKFDIEPTEVILIGQSLGGGVAAHLAASQGCKALVLQKTFTSLPDVAQAKFPFVPAHYLMRNRFDSSLAVEAYDGPVHQSHGETDRVIPFRFGKQLFEKTSHPLSKFVNLGQCGHNDGYSSDYWKQLDSWLDDLGSDPSQ
jgi:fermentation-respiration switch protein FrsA (DUF1100 family)